MGEVILRAFALPGKLRDRWSDRAYLYLRALHRAGVPTRLAPLSPIDVQYGKVCGKPNEMAHWRALDSLLITRMTNHFVNLVIAPLGMSMGGVKTDREDKVTFVPQTMIEGLHTPKFLNLALTGLTDPQDRNAPTHDAEALKAYDELFAGSVHDQQRLSLLGHDSIYLRPEAFAERMREIIKGESQY